MHLICATCRRPLTRECRLGNIEERNPGAQDRQPAVLCGVIVRMDHKATYSVREPNGHWHERVASSVSAYSVNPADTIDGALKPSGVDNGCCGSDGVDGPNRSCVCGEVLGTEWSDCWTQAEVRFEPEAVELVG